MANDDKGGALDALIAKNPIFNFFADFWVWVTSKGSKLFFRCKILFFSTYLFFLVK